MKKYYIVIGLSLLASLFIYLFYRTCKTVINDLVMHFINCDDFINVQQKISSEIRLPGPIVYSLPGGLWVFSVTLISKLFHVNVGNFRVRLLWLPLLFATGLEITQLLHLTNGTFDAWDISLSYLGWSTACLVFGEASCSQNFVGSPNAERLVCVFSFLAVFLAHVYKD